MNAENGSPAEDPQGSQPDLDTLYAELIARASALPKGAIVGADALIADIVMSELDEHTFKPLAAAIGKATGFDGEVIRRQMVKARVKRTNSAEFEDDDAVPPRTRAELEAACARILAAPDVLMLLKGDLPALGIAGPGRVVLGTYVVAQSRRWPKPVHAAVAGPSGTGKSFETDMALCLIDPADIYTIGDGSEKFIMYDRTPLTGRVTYFVEATPLQRDGNSPLAFATRMLMSEGEFRYLYVDFEQKDADGRPTAQEIVRQGPSAVIVTSTADKLHSEIETRLVRFAVDGSAQQTARILGAMAQDLDAPPPDAIIAEWRAFDELLTRFGVVTVAVPFADASVKALKVKAAASSRPLASRLRRDYRHVLTGVQVVAFLNQHARQRDAAGRVVATENDWTWASGLLDPALNRGSLRALSQSAHTVFAELAKRSAARTAANTAGMAPTFAAMGGRPIPVLDVPTRDLAVACGLDQSTVVRALKTLVETGCIQEPERDLRQRIGQYQVVAAPSAHVGRQVLPTWAEILQIMQPVQPVTQSATTPGVTL